MSDSTDAILQNAFDLIENDELEQAQIALGPLLETEDNNPNFWWIYAHAVKDSETGIKALDRVIQLDPNYPGARELKEQVALAKSAGAGATELEAASASASWAGEGQEDDIEDWEDLQPDIERAAQNARFGRGFVSAVVITLLIVALGLLLVVSGAVDLSLLTSFLTPTEEQRVIVTFAPTEAASTPVATPTETGSTPVATPTEAASTPVATPTEAASTPVATPTETASTPVATPTETASTPVATPTEAASTPVATPTEAASTPVATPTEVASTPVATLTEAEAALAPSPSTRETDFFVDMVSTAITDFEIDKAASGLRTTEFGHTLDFHSCAVPGPQFTERLNVIMQVVVSLSKGIPEGVEAIAVSLMNCDDVDATMDTVAVARDLVQAYASDEIGEREYQQGWKPLP